MIKRLDGIRRPYASLHSLCNGIFSVNNSMIETEPRMDDLFIIKKYQQDFDAEPPAPRIDNHAPGKYEINQRPSVPQINESQS